MRPVSRLVRHPRYAVGAPLAAAALVLAGCSGGAGDPAGPAASPAAVEPTPLDEVDTTGVVVPRADPCDALPEAAVVTALGGPATAADRWADGQAATVAPGVRDVVHEWGCAWTAADGSAVRAWVFAPPVTPASARRVARAVEADAGCRALPDAPAFGAPDAARLCRVGSTLEAGHAGLFGDAWLSCSVAAPRAEAATPVARDALVARAGAWCVQVLAAARA